MVKLNKFKFLLNNKKIVSLIIFINGLVIFGFFNILLNHTGKTISNQYFQQNIISIESNDAYSLIPSLNALTINESIFCVEGRKKNILFFESSKNCQKGIFHTKNIILSSNKNIQIEIHFSFTSRDYFIMLSIFILLSFSIVSILWFQEKIILIRHQSEKSLMDQAKQVAHDIRSPLSALNMALYSLQQVPEEKRVLIRSAVGRINDIANSLLEKGKQTTENPIQNVDNSEINSSTELLMVSSLVDSLVSEKRIVIRENSKIFLEANLQKSYGLFIFANGTELKRVLSNLINNSIEAFGEKAGNIEVDLDSNEKDVIISVRDNGKGIPSHILQKLGEKGVTHGKVGTQSGSGLGVYHAKTTVEAFGGKFDVESTEGKGTLIQLIFPKVPLPDWFVSEINISSNQTIVICDDDTSIHGLWSGRLKSILSLLSHTKELHFSSSDSISSWFQQGALPEPCLYLMDYELLNSPKNGLDLIEEFNISKNSILVTSRFEEQQIQDRCKKLGVKLIPKGLASLVPIKVQNLKVKYDVVLIDDDDLIHMTWKMLATEKGKSILCFKSEEDFIKATKEIDFNTPVFIDINLSQGVSGLEVSKRVYELGFNSIHLATGHDGDSILKPDFIKSIIGKDFPLN